MKNIFSKIAELNQANTQAPALGTLVIQGLLELLGGNDSSGYQEVAQPSRLESAEWRRRCVEYLHTNTSTVSAEPFWKLSQERKFSSSLKVVAAVYEAVNELQAGLFSSS